MNKVELYKLGQINKWKVKEYREPFVIESISDDSEQSNPLFKFYLNKLDNLLDKSKYEIQRTAHNYSNFYHSGVPDTPPKVGSAYWLDGWWHTSMITEVIDDIFLLTMNSVYVIHDLQKVRDEILEKII